MIIGGEEASGAGGFRCDSGEDRGESFSGRAGLCGSASFVGSVGEEVLTWRRGFVREI